ncbi:hypothetical protein D0T84_21155 [Dysgonomonas sp. 521]|uniref:hypothetical protein n=1 Tax=Dysgonomonas sp. 521 TaxID=2302932 RepID=UPI0013D5A045|nr:hypothetical protein [Dysgonomonas sp. 521]NDV97386.1 hypothetical protein [Dysgonomonas sp. 521]
MGTSLYAITNSKLTGEETDIYFDAVLEKFRGLNLSKSYFNAGGKRIEDDTEYCYYKDIYDYYPIDFASPSSYYFSLYKNIGIIGTIYRYHLLYNADFYSDDGWYVTFRKDIYNIIQVMGGTEIIFLADNGYTDGLSYYLECLAWEDTPYEIIKEKMITALIKPQLFSEHYKKMRNKSIDHSSISEFIWDDFRDLK